MSGPSNPHPPQPSERNRTARALLPLVAVALFVRYIVAVEAADTLLCSAQLGDAEFYLSWARGLAEGNDLDQPVLFQSPLYPYLLAICIRLFGAAEAPMLVLQALMGATGAALTFLTTRKLFGTRAAWAAGVFAALYAPLLWYEGWLHKTALATLLLQTLLAACILGGRTLAGSALAGTCLGLLALLRPNALLLAAPLLFWFRGSSRDSRDDIRQDESRPLRRTLLFVVLLALPPMGLGLRNWQHSGNLQLLAGNGGVNFYQGNGSHADGLYRPLRPGRSHPTEEHVDTWGIAEAAANRPLSAGDVDRYWYARAWADIRADPGRWCRLLLTKLRLCWHAKEAMDTASFEAYADASRLLKALGQAFSFGSLAPLAALGAWTRRRRLRTTWVLPWSLLLTCVSVVAFLVVGRLRMGLVPFLLPLAGAGTVDLFRIALGPSANVDDDSGLGAVRKRLWPLLLLVLTALVVHLPSPIQGDPRATTYANLANALKRRGQHPEALLAARRAVEYDPTDGGVRFALGAALKANGNADDAREAFSAAARLAPELAGRAHNELGLYLAEAGRFEDAAKAFQSAVASDPTLAIAWYHLGLCMRRLGRAQAASQAYREALRIEPDQVDAQHNLALLLESAGSYMEARQHFEEALLAQPDFVPSLLRLAWLTATCSEADVRDAELALRCAQAALAETSPNCETLDTLAAALAANGSFEQAVLTLEALETLPREDRAKIDGRLRLYRAGQALRQKLGKPLPQRCVP